MYTANSIDEVRDLDIVQVIGKYLNLKKSGASHKIESPFTDDKTPSFMVSQAKQIFKCFSSGHGGDHIEFVMLYKTLNFYDAIELIAADNGVLLEKEEVPDDVKRLNSKKSEMYDLATQTKIHFTNNLHKLDKGHWVHTMLAERGYTDDTVKTWQLGYAQNSDIVTETSKQKGQFATAKDLGITATKENRTYDPYKNRLIFPIYNHKNNVISFGGRRQNGDQFTSAKYINGHDSDIYHKKSVLYGLHLAKTAISKKNFAILVEGYTDVITMHEKGADTTVASCGTALTPEQVKLLNKYCKHVILMRDGDSAGYKAVIRDIDICLAGGLQVSIIELPENDDPDTFARRTPNVEGFVKERAVDAVIWKAEQTAKDFVSDSYLFDKNNIEEELKLNIKSLESNRITTDQLSDDASDQEKKKAEKYNADLDKKIDKFEKDATAQIKTLVKIDGYKKSKGTTEIAQTLFKIKNTVTRKQYITDVSKIIGVAAGDLNKEIGKLEKQFTDRKGKEPTFQDLGLPEGADVKFFLKNDFVAVGNQYWFKKNNGKVEAGSSFIFTPLYHIQGKEENKRLCEVKNIYGQRKLMDFESSSFISFNDLRKQLIELGPFLFNGISSFNFEALVSHIMTQFAPALELQNLGHNAKGFFAFANGIFYKQKWYDTDKYGMIHLPDSDDTEADEYYQKTEYYYSPAYSAMHKHNQKGDDPYENDRKFVLKPSPVTLNEWMTQMVSVFGEKGQMGIVFNFASLFRDVFIKNYKYFPLLGGFGEKDSGKSGFGECLQNFFYYQETPIDLTQSTPVGFTAKMTRITNGVCFCDEYKETILEVIKFGLMGAWNGNGRTKGTIKKNRTTSPNINTAIYYCGQFLPTFTHEEKEAYNKLLGWTNKGLNSLVLDVLKHRDDFIKALPQIYSEVAKSLKDDLGNKTYQPRIYNNYLVMLASYKLLANYIDFPFTYNTFKEQCMAGIIENSEAIQDSNGLTEFWNIMQYLFEHKMINDQFHFMIDSPSKVKVLVNSTDTKDWVNDTGKKLLFLRLNMIHQEYLQVCQRRGIEAIGERTLRNYFKSRKAYYIGAKKSHNFPKANSSCLVFDYNYISHPDNGIAQFDKVIEADPFAAPAEPTEEQRKTGEVPF